MSQRSGPLPGVIGLPAAEVRALLAVCCPTGHFEDQSNASRSLGPRGSGCRCKGTGAAAVSSTHTHSLARLTAGGGELRKLAQNKAERSWRELPKIIATNQVIRATTIYSLPVWEARRPRFTVSQGLAPEAGGEDPSRLFQVLGAQASLSL